MLRTSPQSTLAVLAVVAAVLLAPAVTVADKAPRLLDEPIVLETRGGELHGILPGCPPCSGVSLVADAHEYHTPVELFDAATGERVGVIKESRHNHKDCTALRETPNLAKCFQAGTDVLPDTTLELTVQLDDERGVSPEFFIVAHGDTVVDRYGDGDDRQSTMELRSTVLRGKTDAGIPVVVRIGKEFGQPATIGEAKRIKKGTLPEYVTVVARAYAQFIIGWPEEVAVDVVPRNVDVGAEELKVSVLSSERFDATRIDRDHLTFGATGDELALASCVTEDVDRDGRTDLACEALAAAAELGADSSEAVVRGMTQGGLPFEGRFALDGARVAATH